MSIDDRRGAGWSACGRGSGGTSSESSPRCSYSPPPCSFGLLAEEVTEGDTGGFDRVVLLALRNPADLADPIGPAWVENAARDITSLGGNTVLVLVSLAVIGYLAMVRKRSAALLVFVAVGGGMLLSTLLKHTSSACGRPGPARGAGLHGQLPERSCHALGRDLPDARRLANPGQPGVG